MTQKASRAILDDWYDMTMLCQHIPLYILGYARRYCYIQGVCPICGPQVIEPLKL